MTFYQLREEMIMANYGLFSGKELVRVGDHMAGLLPYTAGVSGWRIVRWSDGVVMAQQVTKDERVLYSITAYVGGHPKATPVDVQMEFGGSLGGAIKMLAQCEIAGLITSEMQVKRNKHVGVRVYSIKAA